MDSKLIGARLKELKDKKGITQEDLSKLTGISKVSISNYERGKVKPPLEFLYRVAIFYKVSMDWLCGVEDINGKSEELKTYADLLNDISNIQKSFKGLQYFYDNMTFDYISVSIKTPDPFQHYGEPEPFEYETNLVIKDEIFCNAIKDYKTMYELYQKGTLSEKIFNDWFEGKIKELSSKSLPKSNDDLYVLPF